MNDNSTFMGISNNSYIDQFKKLTEQVHSHGTPIILQIVHIGSATNVKNKDVIAPSVIINKPFGSVMPREMTKEDINRIKQNFINAGIRAEKIRF